MDPRVEKLISLMERDLNREISLAEMAQSVNLSVWHLCRLFKAETGLSPVRYLRSVRMGRARQLLETTFLRVKEVMTSVGINDKSHFVQDFKRVHGVTPTQLRASLFNVDQGERAKSANK